LGLQNTLVKHQYVHGWWGAVRKDGRLSTIQQKKEVSVVCDCLLKQTEKKK
jgi:hypothetical protein